MNSEKHRILLVEDDRITSGVLKFNFERAGFEVRVAHDGRTAAMLAADSRYDLIMTDFQMPHLNGGELCALIREGGPNQDVPILLCTAKELELDVEALCAEMRVTAVFEKPFSPSEVVRRATELLQPVEATV